MIQSGVIGMPLHFGKMPGWFTERMGLLGSAVMESVVQNHGKNDLLSRLSNPAWFQALAAASGMQYNSSGATAALLGSVRRKINPKSHELGIHILGGKGKSAWKTPHQIARVADKHGLPGHELVKSCQLARRVDNNAVQDGFDLYQQHVILTDEGDWTAIQQGMNTSSRRARRYHWHSPSVRSFVSDPHTAVVGENSGGDVLNLVDARAEGARQHMVSMTQENPSEVVDACRELSMGDYHEVRDSDVNLQRLGAVLAMAHDNEINNFEDLLLLKGVGPRTLKSLALVSELVHGDASRFDDPARFAFAVGGKDGRPHPVDKKALDETIEHLQDSVEKSKLGYKEKSQALKRLHRAVRKIEDTKAPVAHLDKLQDSEWKHAEEHGGMTFMGKVVPGVTRTAFALQNRLLYGKNDRKKK